MRNTEPSRVLSQTAEYALRAALFLAGRETDEPVGVEAIAAATDLPASYLSKTLQTLAAAGILKSVRGRAGGFSLAVAPDKLPLMRVVEAFDERADRRHCLLGRHACSDEAPCAAHGRWKHASEAIMEFFRNTTLADLRAAA